MTIYVFLIWTTVALAWYFLYGIARTRPSCGKARVMTMVVGFAPDGRGQRGPAPGRDAGPLRRRGRWSCARSCPAPWPPSPAKVDAEYQTYLQGAADNALSRARGRLPADVPATFEVVHARSAAGGAAGGRRARRRAR